MKLDTALTLNEETVRNCLIYFKNIYGRPLDINQAANRRYVAEKETGYGKPYYEDSNKQTFFNELNTAILKIKDITVKTKFIDYLKAYIKNSPDNDYICGSEQDKKNKQKFTQDQKERELFKNQTTKIFNNKTGLYNTNITEN